LECAKEEKVIDQSVLVKLCELYTQDMLSISQIARQFNMAATTVRKYLLKANIKLRSYSEATKLAKRNYNVRGKTTWRPLPPDKRNYNVRGKTTWRPLPPEELKELYCGQELSLHQIAQIFNVSDRTVASHLRDAGVEVRDMRTAMLIARKHNRWSSIAERNAMWRGGKYRDRTGYIYVYAPEHPRARHNYVFEHIIIWEKEHQKPLPKGWVIHHLNGVKDDNRIENLIALPSKKHYLILAEKAKRIRQLEDENKKLRQALQNRQALFLVESG